MGEGGERGLVDRILFCVLGKCVFDRAGDELPVFCSYGYADAGCDEGHAPKKGVYIFVGLVGGDVEEAVCGGEAAAG